MKKLCSINLILAILALTAFTFQDQIKGKIPKEVKKALSQLRFIEGGTFNMGQANEDFVQLTRHDSMLMVSGFARRVTVSSFYISEREVSNKDWKQFYEAKEKELGEKKAMEQFYPDTLVWVNDFAYSYNEPMTRNYYWHPAFEDYPVVGVSWLAAQEYCKWKTDYVNNALKESGVLKEGAIGVPSFRLPTEAEWEYAALSLIGPYTKEERITERRLYPWAGHSLRDPKTCQYLANFGVLRDENGLEHKSYLNDGALYTSPLATYPPNDYGLYDMAGNVSEWVQDASLPYLDATLLDSEKSDLDFFRGNIFTDSVKKEAPIPSLNFEDMTPQNIDSAEVAYMVRQRLLYGTTLVKFDSTDANDNALIDQIVDATWHDIQVFVLRCKNKGRIVKGGSWADPPLYLMPGSRQSYPQDATHSFIGFRVAMTRIGSPKSEGAKNNLQSQLIGAPKGKKETSD